MTITIRRTIGLVLLGAVPAIPLALAKEAAKKADASRGYHELGRLRAGLAFKAHEEEHDSLKAALFYLQAAQAFQRAGEDEYHKALMAGVLAAQPLRASWMHKRGATAAFFLAEDKQILTCDGAGDIHIWDVRTGRARRSFKAAEVQEGDTDIKGAVISRDRSRLVLWTWYTVQLWNIAEGKLLQSWKLDVGSLGAAFLHKEQEILVWWREPPVRLYDVATGKELRTFAKGSWRFGGPILDRQEKRMLTGDGKNIYLWDVAKGELRHTFSTDVKDTFLDAAFTLEADAVAVFGYADGSTRLFDIATGRERKSFTVERPKQPARPVRTVVFSNDGKRLLTSSEHEATRLWNRADGTLLHTFLAEAGVDPQASFSPDGKHVIVLGEPVLVDGRSLGREFSADGAVFLKDNARVLLLSDKAELWNLPRRELLRSFTSPGLVDARFSDDESLLLLRSRNGAVRLWDLRQRDGARWRAEEPQPKGELFRHSDVVVTACLSRDEKRLLSCDFSGDAFLWDAVKGEKLRSFEHGSEGRGAIFSPDESRVLTWGGPTAKLWQVGSGERVRTFTNLAELRGCVFSPDGKHLLTWDVDYTARWWDTERGEALHKFKHDRDLFGARLDRKAAHVLTWSLDGTAKKWDLRSGKLVWPLQHDGPVFGAAFIEDEEYVWTWSGKGLHQWSNKSGKALGFVPIKGGVAGAVLDRDGKHFLLRDAQGLLQYMDAKTAKVLATFHHVFNVYGFYESVSAGTFSPDATRAVTWSGDGSIHLWDLASGLKLKTFRQTKAVRGAAFTREGNRILSWSADGTVRLWDAAAPRPLSPDDQLLEVEVRSGLHLDEHGKVQELSAEEWQVRRKKLETVPRKPPRE
jgi:WD40 repeat protein